MLVGLLCMRHGAFGLGHFLVPVAIVLAGHIHFLSSGSYLAFTAIAHMTEVTPAVRRSWLFYVTGFHDLNLNGRFTSTRIRQGQGLIEPYSNKTKTPLNIVIT